MTPTPQLTKEYTTVEIRDLIGDYLELYFATEEKYSDGSIGFHDSFPAGIKEWFKSNAEPKKYKIDDDVCAIFIHKSVLSGFKRAHLTYKFKTIKTS
jgi:hypothetical protein